jgi:mannose-1-phosphate guanylyltransferase/mannose-6-phosphate isomerase
MDSATELRDDIGTVTAAIQPVILTGGAGTRLWPLSRNRLPKPLLPLLSERTLLQQTALRTVNDIRFADPVIVCNQDHLATVSDQMAAIGISPRTIIAEPVGRNTAPALAVAALILISTDPDAVMLVQPSDHMIDDGDTFRDAVTRALGAAEQGWLVTFGLEPERPETGYGYIRPTQPLSGTDGIFTVGRFVEKPSSDEAERLIADDGALWNSGIFLMSANRYLQELEAACPEILHGCADAIAGARRSGSLLIPDRKAFQAVPAISIDYAVMEHTPRAAVLPLAIRWNDIGNWRTLRDECRADADGNVVQGNALLHNVRGSYIRVEKGFVAATGLDDVIVVATDDAVLVASTAEAPNVGKLVERMKIDGRREAMQHRTVHRPWGTFTSLDCGPRHQVKELVVRPGGRLSLQLHHHRSEHWVVVSGTARVVCGDAEQNLYENQSIHIAAGKRHRLENPGKIPLHVIEVQCGSYLGEDDIVRVDDVYGRT